MNIVTAQGLKIRFGPREILRGEGFAIGQGEKVGLIGPNGSGKSTLIKAMYGIFPLDEGAFHWIKGATVGYLPQDVLKMPRGDLLSTVLGAAPGIPDIEKRIEEVENGLDQATSPKIQENLASRLSDLLSQRDIFEQKYTKTEAESILMGLGFSVSDLSRDIFQFSGGWKTRAALAGLLFRKPDLLLLDEPTNHLDLPSVQWLEQFLKKSPRAVCLVTHDREFLDSQVERILSFEFEGLRSYKGNYSGYLKLRREEEQNLIARAKNIEDRKRQATRFINRFRAKNTKATQVQSRIKELEKLALIKVPKPRRKLHFKFPLTPRSGKDVITITDLGKSFPKVKLFEGLSRRVFRGDRIAIIGVNGAGKTSLLKMIAGELSIDSGEIKIGHNINMSYYAQHQSESLDQARSVLDEVWLTVPDATMTFVRGVCGAFLFSGDEVDKSIGVLSGGEKARVSLAKILVKPGNLLVMDEPTNHLDIWSSEALGKALESYDGTLVFVSHNKGFVNRLATKIWDISDGKIYEYQGVLEDYLYHLEQKKVREENLSQDMECSEKPMGEDDSGETLRVKKKAKKREEATRRNELYRKVAPVKKEIDRLEKEIEELEARYGELEIELADPKIYEDTEKSLPLLNDFETVKRRLERKITRWEKGNEKLDAIYNDLGIEN